MQNFVNEGSEHRTHLHMWMGSRMLWYVLRTRRLQLTGEKVRRNLEKLLNMEEVLYQKVVLMKLGLGQVWTIEKIRMLKREIIMCRFRTDIL